VHPVIWTGAVGLAIAGGWMDWRSRRIPNWLTLSGFAAGIALNAVLGGGNGALGALAGAGLALAVLFPFVFLRGLGAGDWKLMGALGAFLGVRGILLVLLATILVNGMMAIIQVARQRRWQATLNNLRQLVLGFFYLGIRPNPVVTLDNPQLTKLPFGVAAAFATAFCSILVWSEWMQKQL